MMTESYDILLKKNSSILEAYANMYSPKQQSELLSGIPHTVHDDSNMTSHSFSPEHLDDVRGRLESAGYTQSGPSDVYGPATETRYVNKQNRSVAHLGKNRVSGWLDIHKDV